MIWQHDAAGPDANRLGAARDVRDHDGSSGAGDPGHVVVLGNPKAMIAPLFRVPRQVKRIAKGVSRGRTLRDRRKIEYRERNHHWRRWFDDSGGFRVTLSNSGHSRGSEMVLRWFSCRPPRSECLAVWRGRPSALHSNAVGALKEARSALHFLHDYV